MIQTKVHALCLFIAAGCLLAGGCSSTGVKRASVMGNVTVNGEPVVDGAISFFPADGNGPTAGGTITNGRYKIATRYGATVGANRVVLTGMKKTGKSVPDSARPGAMREELVQIVPAEWNTNSTQIRELTAGSNELDFDIKTATE